MVARTFQVLVSNSLTYLAQLAGGPLKNSEGLHRSRPRSSLQKPVGTQAFRQFQAEGLQNAFLFTIGASDTAQGQFLTSGSLQLDVADLDFAQFAEDDLRRHGTRVADAS